jgi:uncharacterized flavoprotein (TIGR03862 family)
MTAPAVAVIGGGPAGLMAAEAAVRRGATVELFDAMPSVGRKFLMAGKSGLNLTHAEPLPEFLGRFGRHRDRLEPIIADFDPAAIRAWAEGLGIETFVGSSGRVFPTDFKAAPLLRAWLRRLRVTGVRFHVRHHWTGWNDAGQLAFDTPDGQAVRSADATILALGGASWPKLGSDGGWVEPLRSRGVAVAPLLPANCGFDVGWSDHIRERFAGQPVKPVMLSAGGESHRGEFVVTANGVEGSGIYPLSARLRDEIAAHGAATLTIDLLPDYSPDRLAAALRQPRGSRSLAEHLRRTVGITGVKAGLLRELSEPDVLADPAALARALKSLALPLKSARPIAEAISSAGGIAWESLSESLMLKAIPGTFAAGEMLDWEVTTGGYLLTACLALGKRAGDGAADWLGLSAQPNQLPPNQFQ